MKRLLRRRMLVTGLLILFWTGSASAETTLGWAPARTWVFVVGLLEWQRHDLWNSFPEAVPHRRDQQLVEFFHNSGVPANQLIYLQDAQATRARIEEKFQKLLDATHPGDLLIFYFAGHGYRNQKSGQTWFANYDASDADSSGWNVSSIFDSIEHRFHGDRAWLMADCCHSGALFDLARKHADSKIAFAVLTSSYSHNSSTGRWTFSDSLLAGLRGDPTFDLNGDRSVDLQELATCGEAEMAFAEGQKSMFHASTHFPRSTKISLVNGISKPWIGQRLEVLWKEKWYKAKVIDIDGPRLKIHYVNFDNTWDEWVGPERIRPFQVPQFSPGDQVQVLWKDGVWYPATVQQSLYGLHFVRYTGYDSSWDEWIGPDKIRLPQ